MISRMQMAKDHDEPRPVRIMVLAGEISGDLHAAALLGELRKIVPAPLEVYGIGGDRLKAEGMEILEHCSQTGIVGFWEVLKHGRFFLRLIKKMERLLDARRPDLLLTVDFVSFNMRLAKRAKARGIPVAHYVCPQVWAWKKGRIPEYARLLNRLLVMFPFEADLWNGTGLDVVFTGHPLIDRADESRNDTTTVLPWGEGSGVRGQGSVVREIDHRNKYRIALFPGSRRMEVERHLPTLLRAATLIEAQLGECHFIIPAPTEAVATLIHHALRHAPNPPRALAIVQADSRVVLRDADAAIVKSGTSTLEAALMGCPHVIVYRISTASAWFVRRVIQVPFVGLPNIVAGREICCELLQSDFTPENVAAETLRLLQDPAARDQMKRDMADVASRLDGGGASARAATAVATLLM